MELKEKWGHLIGQCPKKPACGLYRYEAATCRNGPYQYCGKYRMEIETKKQKPLQHS